MSPIIEDDKEDTVNEEYDHSPIIKHKNKLKRQLTAHRASMNTQANSKGMSQYHNLLENYIKPYKAPEIVKELTSQLFDDIKHTFRKEREKALKASDENKENQYNEDCKQRKKTSPRRVPKQKGSKRKHETKPRKLKITDFVKITVGDKIIKYSTDEHTQEVRL